MATYPVVSSWKVEPEWVSIDYGDPMSHVSVQSWCVVDEHGDTIADLTGAIRAHEIEADEGRYVDVGGLRRAEMIAQCPIMFDILKALAATARSSTETGHTQAEVIAGNWDIFRQRIFRVLDALK